MAIEIPDQPENPVTSGFQAGLLTERGADVRASMTKGIACCNRADCADPCEARDRLEGPPPGELGASLVPYNVQSGQTREGRLSDFAGKQAGQVPVTSGFVVKDSGQRQQFTSGMHRDTTEGKLRPILVRSGPMLLRWIKLMTAGAAKYAANNWMLASGQPELDRFLDSADRHFNIWITWRVHGINIEDPARPTREPLSEDHAAAVMFNINGTEYVVEQIEQTKAA